MLQELITLDLRITVPETIVTVPTVESEHVGTLNREIASLGYTLGADALTRIKHLDAATFSGFRRRLLSVITEIAGADAQHQALFRRFPYETPDERTYFTSRIVSYMQNILDLSMDGCEILSCGHVIDTDLFDLAAFGACPLCQQQVPELLYTPIRPNIPARPITPLKVLHLADETWLSKRGSALLRRQSSLSEAEKALLIVLAGNVPLHLPETVFKETLPFVYRLFGRGAVQPHVSGATDILRIAAFVSAADADLSLAKAPRLHLSTRERQDMLALLEGLDDIAEDLLRHVGPWKRFARHVHIGQARYRARYPKTVAAFERVRHDPKGIATYDRIAERGLRAGRVDTRLLDILARRPGSFLRRFDQILRNAEDGKAVLDTLARVAPEATPRLLFTLKKHLEYREKPRRLRVFLPKGNTNIVQIAEDRRPTINSALLNQARAILGRVLTDHFVKQPSIGTVYLDPELTGIVLPYNRRGDSTTNLPVGKGSRFALSSEAEVVRLFVHWTGRDVDLSLIAFDEYLDFIDQISFTNLSGSGLAHSGDIRDAPNGASEFIDVELATMHARGIRYLCMSVISYSGEMFKTFPCFAGFMERDGLNTGAVYDPATVRLKFTIRGTSRSYAPLVLDLAERKVIWVDFATRGREHQAVYLQSDKLRGLVQAALDLPRIKPTAYDVLATYASARGRIVFQPDQAETVYRADTIDAEAIAALLD